MVFTRVKGKPDRECADTFLPPLGCMYTDSFDDIALLKIRDSTFKCGTNHLFAIYLFTMLHS